MRSIIICVLVILFGSAGLYGAGSSLPEEINIHRGVFLKADVNKVAALTSVTNWPSWWRFFSAIQTNIEASTPDALAYNGITRYGGDILFLQKNTEVEGRSVWVLRESWMGMEGGLAVQVSSQDGQTFVKVSQMTKISSPYWRFMWYYVLGKDKIPNYILHSFAEYLGEQKIKIEELVL